MKLRSTRSLRGFTRFAFAVSLAAAGGCDDHDEQNDGPALRDAALGAGSRLVVTLPLQERPSSTGGGMYLVVSSDPAAEEGFNPIVFHVLAEPLDLYPAMEHELHLFSEPLTAEQTEEIAAAEVYGTYLDIITDVPLATVGPELVAAHVAAIDAETGAWIPGGVVFAEFNGEQGGEG